MLDRRRAVCATCPLGIGSLPRACPFRETIFGSDQRVLTQGERPGQLWYLRTGLLLLSAHGPDGNETFCTVREGPALLGTEELQGQASPHEARTLTAAVLCRLPGSELDGWLEGGAGPARAVLELVLSELTRRQDEDAHLNGSATSRVARFLLARLEAGGSEAPVLRRQNIARILRMRPETFSRALRRLRTLGAIGAPPGLEVADETVLRAVAASDPVGWNDACDA